MEQSLVTFSLRFKYDCGTSAASYALRNIAVGYLYECLPLSWTRLIISRRNNIFSFTLKEVILRQSDKAEYQDSGDEKILKLLFNHFESEEEGVSNVETKRLGKIALIEPEKLVTALKILKKICDDPHLLTKRAAADVLEGMESMLKPDVHVAEKLAMHIADVADTDDLEEKHDIVSCKVSFILSLLDNLIQEGHCVLIFSQTHKMLNLIQVSLNFVSFSKLVLNIDYIVDSMGKGNIKFLFI